MKKGKWVGFGVGLLMIAGALGMALWQGSAQNGANVALAQGPSATATPGASGTKTPASQNAKTGIANAFWTALASKLGIGVDDLKSKAVDAEKEVIEQAVTNGTLTRAQADALEQRLSANGAGGLFVGGFHELGRGRDRDGSAPRAELHVGGLGGVDMLEAVAAALNLKPADLSAQLQSGKTLADIAKAQYVDEAKVKQAIIDTTRARIQREVQDGLITQAQADQILLNLTPDKIDLTRTRRFGELHRGPFGPGRTPPANPTPGSSS